MRSRSQVEYPSTPHHFLQPASQRLTTSFVSIGSTSIEAYIKCRTDATRTYGSSNVIKNEVQATPASLLTGTCTSNRFKKKGTIGLFQNTPRT